MRIARHRARMLACGRPSWWAASATASSEYEADSWSATQATGAPDVANHGDSTAAWTPSSEDGTIEWLDLTYDIAVVPSAVSVHESDGSGFVTLIEAYDTATSNWVTPWSGTDPGPSGDKAVFSPPLTPTDVATDRIRITIDTDAPDWNEIDAVELVGTPPG